MPAGAGVGTAALGWLAPACAIPVSFKYLPVFSGSKPYSAGNTTVNNSTSATANAMPAALAIAAFEGASILGAVCGSVPILFSGVKIITGDLVAGEHKSHRHQRRIGSECVAEIAAARPPET